MDVKSAARKQVESILQKFCPAEIVVGRETWAATLESALFEKHSGDMKQVTKHAMSIASSLKCNGSALHGYSASELVTMTAVELNTGTAASKQRELEAAGLVGWERSTIEPPPVLPSSSIWNTSAEECCLVLVAFNSKEVSAALRVAFAGIERVIVLDGNILEQDGQNHTVDAFVSPANTMGEC
jgi:hypothetical protein